VSTSITMYSADWCGDCVRSKRLLDSLQVSYEIIDVESVPGASEPSDIDLKAKLEALKII